MTRIDRKWGRGSAAIKSGGGGASLIRLDIKATGIRLREFRDKRPGQESKLRRG